MGHAAVPQPVALGGGGEGADGRPGGLRSFSVPTEELDNSGKRLSYLPSSLLFPILKG